MGRNGKAVMLIAKNKYKKHGPEVIHFIQPQRASKGHLRLSGMLRRKFFRLTKFIPLQKTILNRLLVILTVKERDKLNREGSWFILLSAPFNCTKETSAITLKTHKEIRHGYLCL